MATEFGRIFQEMEKGLGVSDEWHGAVKNNMGIVEAIFAPQQKVKSPVKSGVVQKSLEYLRRKIEIMQNRELIDETPLLKHPWI